MLLPFKPWLELVQSNFRLSIHKVVQNCLQRFVRMLFRMQYFRVQYFVTITVLVLLLSVDLSGKYDLSPQNGTCFIYKLSNFFYFIKLNSISANAFTDSKFNVSYIRSSSNVVNWLQLSQMK